VGDRGGYLPDEIDRELWSVSFSLAGRHQRSLSCMQLFSHKLASTGLLLAASSLIILLFQSWIDCCFSHQLLFRGTSVQPRDENFQILATPVNAFIQLLLTGNAALWIIQMHISIWICLTPCMQWHYWNFRVSYSSLTSHRYPFIQWYPIPLLCVCFSFAVIASRWDLLPGSIKWIPPTSEC